MMRRHQCTSLLMVGAVLHHRHYSNFDLVGDLPVAYVRFVASESLESVSIRFERFAVLKSYQQSGIGYKALSAILQKVLVQKSVSISVVVPPSAWLQSKLHSFGFVKSSEVTIDGHEQWQCTFGAENSNVGGNFKAFVTFITQKASALNS